MIEIKDGTLKVTAFYGLKVPVNKGGFAMQDGGCSFGLDVALPAKYDMATLAKDAANVFAQLETGCKLSVFAQLGVDFDTIDGVLVAKVIEQPRQQKAGGGSRPTGGQQRSSNQRQRTPAKSAGRDLPIVSLGGIDYFDQRPLKADGTFKEGAADFRGTQIPAGRDRAPQLWLYDKDGTLNEGVADMLDEAGVAWADGDADPQTAVF